MIYMLDLMVRWFLDNQKSAALNIAEEILASPEKLPDNTQTNFYAKLAKLYEGRSEPQKAIIYWEKVLLAQQIIM